MNKKEVITDVLRQSGYYESDDDYAAGLSVAEMVWDAAARQARQEALKEAARRGWLGHTVKCQKASKDWKADKSVCTCGLNGFAGIDPFNLAQHKEGIHVDDPEEKP